MVEIPTEVVERVEGDAQRETIEPGEEEALAELTPLEVDPPNSARLSSKVLLRDSLLRSRSA